MMAEQDLLLELGTEELPPKALLSLSQALVSLLGKGLENARLSHAGIESFASPRRLGLIIRRLQSRQEDSVLEKFGPAVKAAFAADGKPTRAAEGFAASCGVTVGELEQQEDGKSLKLLYRATQPGAAAAELLPDLIRQALAALPVPRRMRWGSSRTEFVRPVHWLVLMLGEDVLPASILDLESGNITYGHRFLAPQAITLRGAEDYRQKLLDAHVIAAFDERRETIRKLVLAEGQAMNAEAIIDENLLDEVTALVEWPVALTGNFSETLLSVPKEALISSMKEHQKCFHLLDKNGAILPKFITVSNLISRDPAQVIEGNERVIGPRLKDAHFFFEQDKKQSLAGRREQLKNVVFQQELGTLWDKSERVRKLSAFIAGQTGASQELCERAASLGKCDLLTSMVYEFAELQGIMAYYYARHDGEPEELATALREQYLPRFAGDGLPVSESGTVLALAERIDTLTGLFGIGQPPTGSKDPFALRRATLGILRIIIEKQLDLDLRACLARTIANFSEAGIKLSAANGLEQQLMDFIFERLRNWYAEQGISSNTFLAVAAVRPDKPLEFDQRIRAVSHFAGLAEADALAAANKRVANILLKSETPAAAEPEHSLLQEAEEKALAQAIEATGKTVQPLLARGDYTAALAGLASLRATVDDFFDKVMVNTEDERIRNNRLALLQKLRGLFLQIADISHLQKS